MAMNSSDCQGVYAYKKCLYFLKITYCYVNY